MQEGLYRLHIHALLEFSRTSSAFGLPTEKSEGIELHGLLEEQLEQRIRMPR